MCGIAGWIDWDRDVSQHKHVIEGMTEALAHRGPDAYGYWISERAALGHRRLTVVDPEGGAQPMSRQRGDHLFVIVYNGELYNTAEVRADLEQCGYAFGTRSDTEVLLTSYLHWGPACVERLNGIFAFAIWEPQEQRLFLARDRLGVKPLFYARLGSALLFGSELKALLAHPLVEPAVDAEGLAEILFLGPSRTPGHGIFRGVHELKPAHWLLHDHNATQQRQYWRLQSQPHTDDLSTTSDKVRWLVTDSIQRQLISDVPIGTFLSGGLDSSILTAVAAETFRQRGQPRLHTWSVDFADNDRYFQSSAFQPEADAVWIKRVSAHVGTEQHHVLIDTPELISALTTAAMARDLPGMADIDASLYLFCRAVKRELTVVLSGECADEIFGGYPWFHTEEALRSNTFPWIRMVDRRKRLFAPALHLTGALDPTDYIAERYRQTIAEVPRLPGEEPTEARRREMFYLNMTWFMATLLDRKDRMSMAAGLEARVPFCDHRIVEYVWNIPWSIKRRDGREKGILRHAMTGVLPDDVLHRRKSPYPKTHNPAYFQAVCQWVLSILADANSPLHILVDAEVVREMASSDGSASGLPWFGQLMGTAQFLAYLGQIDTWMKKYNIAIR